MAKALKNVGMGRGGRKKKKKKKKAKMKIYIYHLFHIKTTTFTKDFDIYSVAYGRSCSSGL